MRISRSSSSRILGLLLISTACGGSSDGPVTPSGTPATITITAGDQQQAAPGEAVAVAPTVVVRDAEQRTLAGVSVTFSVAAGGGTTSGARVVTDASGVARLGRWSLGTEGEQRLTATAGTVSVTFHATLSSGTGTSPIVTSIAPTGGAFEITQSGHPYRGLRLTVPPSTFSGSATFGFSVVEKPSLPALPAGFRVSGPVLAITSSMSRGAELMTLRVPVSHATNEQVLLAYYDPSRRVTEFLPAAYRDDTLVVALVSHLRPDLLTGPGLASLQMSDPVGWLMPVSYPVPLPSVASVLSSDATWPVLDFGSASYPNGFGAAIPAIQSMAAVLGQSLAPLEPGLQTPGFYGDGAQLAAVVQAAKATAGVSKTVSQFLTGAGQISQQIAGSIQKEKADELANQLVVASLALNKKPFPVALTNGSAQSAGLVVATAVSGSDDVVGILAPAARSVASMARRGSGFVQAALQQVGDGPQVQVDRVVPLSSFLTDFRGVAQTVQKVAQVAAMTAGSAARITATNAMLLEAAIPQVNVEMEAAPGTGFVPLGDDPIVARSDKARIRIPTLGGSTSVTFHTRGGGVVAESEGAPLTVGDIPPVKAAADLQVSNLVVSSVTRVAGGVRQLSTRMLQALKAPFTVSPTDAKISKLFTKIAFTSSVPVPPTPGFGIEWDWGDGNFGYEQNSSGATHEFLKVMDYQVIATLVTVPDYKVLAADTVTVTVDQSRNWQLLTFADADNLFSDPDVEVTGPIAEKLQRALAQPSSTLLTVNQLTVNTTELQLQTLMEATWDPTICCPPVPPTAFRTLVLGTQPNEAIPVGPYFSAWNSSFWSESTEDLNTGVMSSQYLFGTTLYNIKDVGSQTGPAGAVRLSATRNGLMMSGTITIYIWDVNLSDGKLSGPPEEYHFPFTAKRLR